MRTKLLLAGLMAAALPASAALAQPPDPGCLQSNHDSRVEGTVLGAVGGALIGGALGHGAGAAVGGLTGAVAGNAIAGSRNDPCPAGYYRAPPPGYGPGYGPPPPPAYGPGYGPERPPAYGAGYGPPPGGGGFWAGAPMDVNERVDFMRDRLQRAVQSGRLSPPQARRAFGELHRLRAWIDNRRARYGRLSPDDRAYVQASLDHLGQSIHWMERTGY